VYYSSFKHIHQPITMGVKGLYSYINKHCTDNGNGMRRPLSYFQNKTIIIDVSIYLYKFKYLTMSVTELFDNLIDYLLNFNIKVILVFDGSEIVSVDKKNEHDVRKKQKETTRELIDIIDKDIAELKKEMETQENMDIIRELLVREKTLLQKKKELEKTITHVSQTERRDLYLHLEHTYRKDVEFMYEKTEEADKMISRIARKNNGKVIVMSDDTDMFLYGSPVVAMNYDHITHTVNVYNLKTTLQCLNMTLHEFVQACVVIGTDYLSPYHENSPLPKVSITQTFMKFHRFKSQLSQDDDTNVSYKKYNNQYTNFIDLMCFVYWKNSKYNQFQLNRKLWSIFDLFYEM
jgi:5'-3' exonuclease